MKERRKFPRYDSALEVKYSTQGDAGIEGYTVSRNVSLGGILIPVSKFIKNGDVIKLDIDTNNNGNRVAAYGRVKWTQAITRPSPLQMDAGIEFTRIEPQDARRLVVAV